MKEIKITLTKFEVDLIQESLQWFRGHVKHSEKVPDFFKTIYQYDKMPDMSLSRDILSLQERLHGAKVHGK